MKIEQVNDCKMLVDDQGNVVFPPIALDIKNVGEGVWAIKVHGDKAPLTGLIDSKGKLIVPYDEFVSCSMFCFGLIKMEDYTGFKYFNKDGVLVYLAKYVDYASDFDGRKIDLKNYDEDEFTHQRQIAYSEVFIDDITKPYKKQQRCNGVTGKADDSKDENEQTSLFNL